VNAGAEHCKYHAAAISQYIDSSLMANIIYFALYQQSLM
jgi:hypothetical protein